MSDPHNLTGVWYGRYVAHSHDETNRFIAALEDHAGVITGTITEPDSEGFADIRRAHVSGARGGSSLTFVKQYDGAIYAHALRYDGAVNDDATEISGTWSMVGAHGGFVMEREKFGAAELEDVEEIELEVLR